MQMKVQPNASQDKTTMKFHIYESGGYAVC